MAETTAAPYLETFGCGLEALTGNGWVHDHDPRTDCRWGYRCSQCRTEDLPCAVHAPREFPGLMPADCHADPPHAPSWVLANDAGYGAPCMWCAYDAVRSAHEGCEHSRHRAWQSWRVTGWLLHKGRMAGFITGGMWSMSSHCPGCHSGFRLGRSGYVLGRSYGWWGCVLRRHHRPAYRDRCGGGFGLCVKCSPCPGCETCLPAAAAAVTR